MSITKGLYHVAMKVDESKFDAVVKFYIDVFGFTIRKQMGKGKEAAVQLNTGNGSCLEIFANGTLDLPADGVIAHLGFWVDDPDAAAEKITAAGGKVTLPPMDMNMETTPPTPLRVSFFRGLAGELVEIFYEK